MNSRSFVLSALIAGAVMGFLANLPVLNLINCFLCIWIWAGGALAVFLYRRFEHGELGLTALQGAGLGALSGLIGAFVGVIVYMLTSFISLPLFASMARMFEIEGDLPFQEGGLPSVIASAFFFLLVNAVLYPLFGAISASITASLLRKNVET